MPKLENILLVGASGRMGNCVQTLAQEQGISVQKCTTRPYVQLPLPWPPDTSVVIDFSCDSVTGQMVAKLLEGTPPFPPLVIGTTGLSHDTMENIKHYAQRAACLVASNFSLGVAILRACVRLASAKLPDAFEAEIIEIHHRHKRDIPSGTAQLLLNDIRDARMLSHDASRETAPEPVKIHSLRIASVVGEHQVIFAGPGEQLRFVHQAENRSVFAHGALYAAQWICGQNPGLYHIEDVFGI